MRKVSNVYKNMLSKVKLKRKVLSFNTIRCDQDEVIVNFKYL